MVRRIGSRRGCSNKACSASYNLAFRPPKVEGLCDRCGSKLMIRDDDKEETIRRRLVEFHRNTEALIEHYRRANLLREISALDSMDGVARNIETALTRS